MTSCTLPLKVYALGVVDYQSIWQQMQDFTNQRTEDTPDELWLVEHPAVFTQGQAGKPEHLLQHSDIPLVQSDRGGQVTYHGPGQLVAYPLINLRRLGVGVRELVTRIEQSVVNFLASYNIESAPKADAPGVYVDGCKIASLGLRVRKGCSFHGVAINIDVDLAPFQFINPCGYAGLQMVKLQDLVPTPISVSDIAEPYARALAQALMLTPEFQNEPKPWLRLES